VPAQLPRLIDRAGALRLARLLALLVVSMAAIRGLAPVLPTGPCLALALLLTLLVPGLALARVLGLDDALEPVLLLTAAVPLGCAAWSMALMAALVMRLSLVAMAAAVAAISLAAIAAKPHGVRLAGSRTQLGGALAGGVLLALAAWRYETPLHGDALFHAGRVRKLLDLPELTLSGLSSVWHGSPHAGYVVPVLHAIEAVAIRITGAEPSAAYSSLGPACALLLPLVTFALGTAAAGRTTGMAAALLASSDALARGSLETMQQPPTFAFFVLIPAVLALALAASRAGFDRRTSRALLLSLLAVALIHATYAAVPLACLAAVVIVTRHGWRLLAAGLALTAVIYAVIWAVALRAGTPQPRPPVLASVFVKAGGNPIVTQAHWMLDQRLDIALGAAAVLPLMLVYRSRHAVAAAVMAGALVLCSLPGVPALLTAVFGSGQVKRFPRGGLPWALTAAIALVEVAALTGRRAALALALLLALASIGYQAFDLEGAVLTAAIAMITVAAVATAVVLSLRGRPLRVNAAAQAAPATVALLVLALMAGTARAERSQISHDLRSGPGTGETLPRLPEAVIGYFRAHDQSPFPVVLAQSYIGYQLAGEADIYPVALPLERTRGEPRNAPKARARAVNIALSGGAPAALRARIFAAYHVRFVLVNAATTPRALAALAADGDLRQVLRDGTWVAFQRRQ
jgi:hypothetical protein